MREIFSADDDGPLPELQVFDSLSYPADTAGAIEFYWANRAIGWPIDFAIEEALRDITTISPSVGPSWPVRQ